VLLADRVAGGSFAPAVAGLAAILGHVYPSGSASAEGREWRPHAASSASWPRWPQSCRDPVCHRGLVQPLRVGGSVLASLALGPLTYAANAPPATVLARWPLLPSFPASSLQPRPAPVGNQRRPGPEG
jgi:hypothetical protein